MVKHTQAIRQLLPTNCLSVFNHFVGLALKGLRHYLREGRLQISLLILSKFKRIKFYIPAKIIKMSRFSGDFKGNSS